MDRINYLALGDSLTVGYGAMFGRGFVDQYCWLAQQRLHKYIGMQNVGKIGATSGDIAALLTDADIRYLVQIADLITLTAGGNDLIRAAKQYYSDGKASGFQTSLQHCHENYKSIINTLYNPLPQLAEGIEWVTKFNQNIQSFEGHNIRMAKIYAPFLGKEKELLSFDHIHPNARGYHVIAAQLDQLGYAPLA
jgi:lysophospholipase L1-like esterase